MAGTTLKRHRATSVLEAQPASANQRQKQVRHGIDAAMSGDYAYCIWRKIMLTESFTAHDSDGNIYEIIRSSIDVTDLHSKTEEEIGVKFHTSDGLDVTRLSKGRYLIVKINIIVESTDPNAY